MEEKLISLIAKELSVPKEKITLDTDIHEDLGADSLDAVELIMSIEDAFEVRVPDTDAQRLRTVRDMLKFIETSH